jgi:thioredoxin reductase (NADPH)
VTVQDEPGRSSDGSRSSEGAGAARTKRPVILAVDDEPPVLGAVRADLRSRYGRDYRVMSAPGGAEAIEVLKELKLRGDEVPLVVSDQRMPDVVGTEVLGAAKELFAGVRTVLLTAYADTDVAITAINDLRLDYYVLKPWDPPEERLYPILDELLEDWHASHLEVERTTRVIGSRWSAEAHAGRDFLQRNQVPMRWLDVELSEEGRRLLGAAGDGELPIVLTEDDTRLVKPSLAELAAALGLKTRSESTAFDLAIVGGGPAGLAAAVYGASEGLATVCIEQSAPGGQAGQSSRIENYLGFPAGITGADLARRAVTQARRFHVEMLSPATVAELDLTGPYPRLELADGSEITCGALILACGVTYRRLDVPGAAELEGRGVYYGAGLSERDTVSGEEIVIVGGANSAGQAAVFFSEHAAKVTILCRGTALGARMSSYLVEQIEARPNIEVRTFSRIRELMGDEHLESVVVEDTESGSADKLAASAMFVFIGASPGTEWLPPRIATDDDGFLLTGPALGDRRFPTADGERDPFLYETSVPGVFAVGDVRARSVKRVASAVGEGSVAVQFVHQFLNG